MQRRSSRLKIMCCINTFANPKLVLDVIMIAGQASGYEVEFHTLDDSINCTIPDNPARGEDDFPAVGKSYKILKFQVLCAQLFDILQQPSCQTGYL